MLGIDEYGNYTVIEEDIEEANEYIKSAGPPTLEQRLEAVESAITELAEVVSGG